MAGALIRYPRRNTQHLAFRPDQTDGCTGALKTRILAAEL